MKIRPIRSQDQDQLYELFMSAQVKFEDITHNPRSGFFEYNLSYEELKHRSQGGPLNVVLEDNQLNIAGYLIGYQTNEFEMTNDAVHQQLPKGKNIAYADQLYLQKGLPVYLAMRLFDAWDFLAQKAEIDQVFTAVPTAPWSNRSSHRLVTFRGFKKMKQLKIENEIKLGLYEKPYFKEIRMK